jgi:hypothetical protein
LPRFDFNWRDLGGGQLKTWLRDPGLNAPCRRIWKKARWC